MTALSLVLLAVSAALAQDDGQAALAAYSEGRYEDAFRLAQAPAAQGVPSVQMLLASMYADGVGTRKSQTESQSWYRAAAKSLARASDAGDIEARGNLAGLYLNGDGVAKNTRKGFALAKDAALKGDPAGMQNLATCYDDGMGVAKDPAEALAWYLLAQYRGYGAGDEDIQRLQSRLKPAQVQKARQRAEALIRFNRWPRNTDAKASF